MDFFRNGKMRLLYLLALVQLVGGPLVLLQVTVFCKLVVRETPSMGVAKATVAAWSSGEFHAALASHEPRVSERKSLPTGDGPKGKILEAKQPFLPWEESRWRVIAVTPLSWVAEIDRVWTPVWPQAPPGPPPRLG